MFCKTMKSTGYYKVFLAIGFVSLAFGFVGDRSGIASTGGEEMLLGMFFGKASLFLLAFMAFLFAGFGDEAASFLCVGAIWVLTIVFAVSHAVYARKIQMLAF